METTNLTAFTANAVLTYLRNGGTHLEGALLADRMQNECNAAAIETEARAKVEAEITSRVGAAVGAALSGYEESPGNVNIGQTGGVNVQRHKRPA